MASRHARTCLFLALFAGCSLQALGQATSITANQVPAGPAAPAATTQAAAQQAAPATQAAATQAATQTARPAAQTPVTPTATATIPLSGKYLTTKDQANAPTLIVDETGKEIVIHGIGWYGFNTGGTAPMDMTKGLNAISQDLEQIAYRMKMLGFNSIRIPLSFDNVWGLGQAPPITLTRKCIVPSPADIEKTLVPPAFPALPLAKSPDLPQSPPEVPGGICNAGMPTESTLDRFIWVVQQFVERGFYINVDYHSNKFTDDLAQGDGSIYKQATWTATWVQLLDTIIKSVPNAAGKLLIDLVNEPDGFGLDWTTARGSNYPSLTDLYVKTIDAMYPICPGCIFLVEGTGQANYCGVNWGNGFATNPQIIAQNRISDATPFFQAIMGKPWLSQVVLAPHFYCPGVSGADACYAGAQQWTAFDNSVGYLTRAPGYCAGSKCKVFAAINDEFGSTLNTTIEKQCMASILSYMNGGKTGSHAPFTSWYYWAWQPDSNGTGGMVDDDWTTIRWDKVNSLTGGTKEWVEGVGLSPWYLSTYNATAATFAENTTGPLTVVVSSVTSSNPDLPAAATPADAPSVVQWVASTQSVPTNGAPAGIAAIGGLFVAALVACVLLVLA